MFSERSPKTIETDCILKAIGCKEFDAWIHFYEDDVAFERIWNTPNKYLPIIKKFKGVITPDFSVYLDMPLVMQQWNIARRAIGHWLQENGVSVIPNIRFGDERTYELSCAGIQKYGTIAVGSHGCIKLLSDRNYFVSRIGILWLNRLEPNILVVYGAAPVKIFAPYKEKGIEVLQFDSDFMKSRKAVGA